VRFTIELVEVTPVASADAIVTGDIRGTARLTVAATDRGCEARLQSSLEPANRVLRGIGVVARPMIEWGHDWVLDQGQRQFVRRAVDGQADRGLDDT
jgi:hypothetical protein